MVEVNSGPTVVADYVYAGGQLIAQYKNSTLSFVHGSHLGSSAILTSVAGAVVDCNALYPFGEQDISICVTSNDTSHKFTGDERDTETNLDHTWFRKYSSAQGRWMTPDPAGLAAVDPANPQSWNRYAYVLNDPLDFIDPLGLEPPCGDPDPHVFNDALQTQNWGDYYFWSGGIAGLGGLGEVVTGGNGKCHDAQRHGGNGGSGSGGTTIGPAPPGLGVPCRIEDPTLGAIEVTVKVGPALEFGKLNIGFSLYKNMMTGESGGKGELSYRDMIGLEVDNPTPPGGNLGGTSEGPEFKISALTYEKNFSRGTKGFKPSRTLGLQFGVGLEFTFNPEKFGQINIANDACRARGGS